MRQRSVLRNREFAALTVSQGLSSLGDQLARIAVAVLVLDRTHSPFAASATYAVSYLTYLVGGPFLAALADRYPRLTVMVVCDLLRVPVIGLLVVAGVPLWVVFVALGVAGALAPPFDAARSGMQPEILQGDDYLRGNVLITSVLQIGQLLGFAGGGALVAALNARAALAIDGATFLLSGGLLLLFLQHRAAAQARDQRGSLFRDTAQGFVLVGRDRVLRTYLGTSLISAAVLIATEGLAVPAAAELHRGSTTAGLLTACVPAGVAVGGLFAARTSRDLRQRLLVPLSLLSSFPLLFSAATQNAYVLGVLWFLAGVGGAVSLIASAAFVLRCPAEMRSRAYGVAVTGLNATQGLALLVAGALTSLLSSRGAVATFAGAGLLVFVAFEAMTPLGSLEDRRQEKAQGTPSPSR